ncbi:kinase-like protein [Colletotrichum zoysiae]|uniref:Kinase-like protein n=1 Tax=Colletotrichum zoysiae TaxID=1216348 RepID=A0AAD9M7A8_9PEZI|nr:kinase-like protein [Colletotrichum zoysiae]
MSLRSRTSARQPPRQLSTSKFNQSESQTSPSESTRNNARPQPQPQSRSRVQRHSAFFDSSDDEILVPMKLSALTKALLNDEQSESGAKYATIGDQQASPSAQPPPLVCARRSALAAPTSSISKDRGNLRESADDLQLPPAKPMSPAASQGRGSSPAPSMRVVRLNSTPRHGILQSELRRSLSTSTQETRVEMESRKRSGERESHFQTQAEMDERQPNQEYAQTSINTSVSLECTTRASLGSSGRRIRSAGSSVVTYKRFRADGDAITPAKSAIAERAYVADNLRSTMRSKRVISVSGSLLGGPARRGRRRQTEDIEAYGEELLATAQDLESQQAQDIEPAAINQTAMTRSTSRPPISAAFGSPVQRNHPVTAAIGKRASLARLLDMDAQRTVCNSESPHHGPVPLPEIPSVRAKEVQASVPAKSRRTSTKVFDKDSSKPASPVSLETGPCAPQQSPISLERRALAVKGPNKHCSSSTLPPPKTSVVETSTAIRSIKKRQFLMRVNGRAYTRIDCIGRGGSGKVYRVATASGTVFALKRVSLTHMDEFTEKGLRGEIELLQRLRGVERVIQLIDYEMNTEKQALSVLMEVGELDFDSLLKNRQSRPEAPAHSFDITFVRYYWKEMLDDLKPANFVLVRGKLKLIDFGIANAIQTDVTSNVYRESMAGTVGYMSPESLMDSTQYAFTVMQSEQPYTPASGAHRVVKIGKPSDVWSLGCILYQMVYGISPFGKLAGPRSRIQAIVNWSHHIEIPATTEDGSCVPLALLHAMRRCLSRDQTDRPTCETLLSEANNFLYPKEYGAALSAPREGQFLPMTEELLGRVIQSVRMRCKEGFPADDRALAAWTKAYWVGLEKAVEEPKPRS